MKKIASAFVAVGLLGGAVSLVAPTEARAQSSTTAGSLRGQIRDKATGEAAVGATVVATSPALQGEQVVITEDGGAYFLTSLPPGVYTLTVYYNDATFTRGNVLIQVGKEAVVNVAVDTSAAKAKGETIVIEGSAPIIDQGSTKTGVTLTDDYTRNIPVGRTFGAVLGSAAGAKGDTYGISIAGAGSPENTYIVEGINTTDTGLGGQSTNLPNEFISETEVITGGYNAEYGRATGGIINVVTKQGSNEFHGSVFGYYKPGTLVASALTIQREGSSIDSKTDLNYNWDVGAEVGGPIVKDKLWFHVGFNPSMSKSTTTRLVNKQLDADMDGVPDVDPNTGFTRHELVSQSEIPGTSKTYFFTGKINGAINANHQFQISAFGNPSKTEDVFGLTRNPAVTKWKYDSGAYDVSAKWTSKFNEGKTQIDAVAGFHRSYETDKPFDSNGAKALVFYNYTRSLFDFADNEGAMNIAACNDADPNNPVAPGFRNCPVSRYADQGLGFLETKTNDRSSVILSLTQRVKAAGYHTFKAGLDAELPTYNSQRSYTGDEILRRSANTSSGAPGRWQRRQFMKLKRNLNDAELMLVKAGGGETDLDALGITMHDPGDILCAGNRAICGVAVGGLNADTTNRNLGAYLQDSWQVKPNFTINAGLRWESQTGFTANALQNTLDPNGEKIPEKAYELGNLLAPRVGFIYDPTREGKAKLFGNWGRFYENVPMDVNVRAFGGEITNFTLVNFRRLKEGAAGYDPNCNFDHADITAGKDPSETLGKCKDLFPQALLGEGVEFVSPGIKGQYTQELVAGFEYEVANDLKVGMTYQHRSLPRVIEDVSTDGGNTYLITNPGENFDTAAADLLKKAAALRMMGDDDSAALASLYESRASQLQYVKKFDSPTRFYDAVAVSVTQRPTKASLLLASYTYSVNKGNYPGLFSTETGQLDPNITSLYDLPDLMANRYGYLGLDRPHNLKVDGFYQFNLKKAGLLTAGASFRAQSGIAHNALASHPTYGSGESYLLPRGAFERSPVTTNLDLHLSYGRKLSKSTVIEGFINVFNLANSQRETSVDENYTFDNASPIVGGDLEDLKHVKAHDENGIEGNTTVTPNKNFGKLNGRLAPRNVQFGVRLTF